MALGCGSKGLGEVEGNLDFVREPSLEATRSCEGQAAPNGLQEKLEAVAIHLEALGDVAYIYMVINDT